MGTCAALLGASEVMLTDLAYSLPGCQATIDENRAALADLGMPSNALRADELDWFKPPPEWALTADVVLAADVVWLTELVPPFVRTLATLLPTSAPAGSHGGEEGGSGPGGASASTTNPVCILSYQRRGADADQALWQGLAAMGFIVSGPITFDPELPGGSFASDVTEIGIFVLSR